MRAHLLLGFIISGCAARPFVIASPSPAGAPTCIARVQVFDGNADALTAPVDVRLAYGRIESITDSHGDVPAGCRDGAGKTLLPGLIDSHAHFGLVNGLPPWDVRLPEPERNLERFLFAGVTTVLSPEGSPTISKLGHQLHRGELLGPTLLFASRIFTARDGHPIPMYRSGVSWPLSAMIVSGHIAQLAPDTDVDAMVAKEAESGPRVIKVVYDELPLGTPHLTLEQLELIISAGRRYGLPVVVHVGSAKAAVEAAQAGASMLMHVPWQDAFTDEDVKAIAETHVPIVSTRRIYEAVDQAVHEKLALHPLELALCPSKCEASFAHRPSDFVFRGFDASFEAGLAKWDETLGANLQKLRAAGVTLLAGTDSGIPGVIQGASLHRELQSLVTLGFSPAEALKSATSIPARVLQPNRRVGVVEVGADADLLLVDGDPLADIRATENIVAVWHGGREVLRQVQR